VVDLRGEVRVAQRGHAEADLLPDRAPQRLALRHLEAQAQPRVVDDGGQDVARLHELPGVHRLRVDDAGVGRTHLGAAAVLERDVPGGLGRSPRPREALRLLLRAVQLLRRHQLLAGELLAALQVGCGPARLGHLLLVGGLGLLGLEAIAVGIDAQEHGLRAHAQALVEVDEVTTPSTSAVTCATSSASRLPTAWIL
jgi:hypothetical protein